MLRLWLMGLVGFGCSEGAGNGFVVGALTVPGCEGGNELDAPEFDLGVDYFAGERFDDPDQHGATQRDTLSIRLQHTGGNRSAVDGLSIQVTDLGALRAREVAGVSDECGDPESCPVRASLSLVLRCPDAYENYVAEGIGACPANVDAEALCDGSFDSRSPYEDRIAATFGADSSCILFCEIGDEFGDPVSAAFRMRLVDLRAGDSPGWLLGRFRFELSRSRSGLAFP